MRNLPKLAVRFDVLERGLRQSLRILFVVFVRTLLHDATAAGDSLARDIDPVVCAAHMITALQTVVSRNVDPLESAVISVTRVQSGTAYNIIPQDAELWGTIRTFKLEVRDLVERRMREITSGVAQAMGCTASLEVVHGTLPVRNDPVVTERVRSVLRQFVGEDGLITTERTMGAEDVGLLMDDIPGMYFFVGAAVPNQKEYFGHHHPRFDFDENALPFSVALMSSAVADYVIP